MQNVFFCSHSGDNYDGADDASGADGGDRCDDDNGELTDSKSSM